MHAEGARVHAEGARLHGEGARLVGGSGPVVRAAPAVSAYAGVLLVTTVLLRLAPEQLDDRVLAGSSTDVTHLTHDPVRVLAALLVTGVPDVPPDMTTWGHAIAAVTGVCWWPHLRRQATARATRLAVEEATDARDAPARRSTRRRPA
ncbi:MAG: hypothetical protein JWR20_1402 [Marmoricola sp.]|nr:hypothetical protein [Marmoricola sp.]